MVKKISGSGKKGKPLQSKRLKLKRLHRDSAVEREALRDVSADQLPPASSSNAARQARSRLNITFPVDWQALHLRKESDASPDENAEDEAKKGEYPGSRGD